MKGTYDAETDTLRIVLNAAARIAESDETKPGVILDYNAAGNLVALEGRTSEIWHLVYLPVA